MKENLNLVTCQQAKEIDMVAYLAKIGLQPKRIKGNDHWYISPFRDEHTPSFKVNRNLNRWYDFGEGCGGNLVDFAVRYHRCNVAEFLSSLNGSFSFDKPLPPVPKAVEPENNIEILQQSPLISFPLISYLKERGISHSVASKYCCQVSYRMNEKTYYGIGFKNDKGGFEIRNRYYKTSSSPKWFTHLKYGAQRCCVFEGFTDFLSFKMLYPNLARNSCDFIILNSLSFFELAIEVMQGYASAHLYLDNDNPGRKATDHALSLDKRFKDESKCYTNHKDLNDYLCSSPALKQSQPQEQRQPKCRLRKDR